MTRKKQIKNKINSNKSNIFRYYLVIFQIERLHIFDRELIDKVDDLLEKISTSKEETEIDVWLESPGGSADIAYKLGCILRSKCKKLRIIVPDYAKSAATLFCLSADELYMAPAAELGPLDAQLKHPETEEKIVSALDIVQAIDHLAEIAISVVLTGGAKVLNVTKISPKTTLQAMFDFASKFIEPISNKIDPLLVHGAWRELKLAQDYASRLLKVSGVCKPPKSSVKIESISRKLAQDYPSHSFVIDIDEAKTIGMDIKSISYYDKSDNVINLYKEATKSKVSVITLFNDNDLKVNK